MRVGVVVGRFQVPVLHDGHEQLLRHAQKHSDRVVIVIGSANKPPSHNNPLDFPIRERIVQRCLEKIESGVGSGFHVVQKKLYTIVPLPDRRDNQKWVLHLDSLIHAMFPNDEVTLFVGRASGLDAVYQECNGRFKVSKLREEFKVSATLVRENIGKNPLESNWDPAYNAKAIIWATQNQYPKVYPTVDIALWDKGGLLTLIRKKGESKWRFPGGFVDPSDLSYEWAAKRELKEECGDIETDKLTYLGSYRIDDWRYRNEKDKIVTTFFTTRTLWGKLEPGDDANEMKHVAFPGDINEIMPEHHILYEKLLERHKQGVIPGLPPMKRDDV